jgi:hypothetical protein
LDAIDDGHGADAFFIDFARQKIIRLLWNLKVHCRVHKNPPLGPILSQINPAHTSSLKMNYTNIAFLPPNRLLISGLPTKHFYTSLLSIMRAPYPATHPP